MPKLKTKMNLKDTQINCENKSKISEIYFLLKVGENVMLAVQMTL